MERLRKQLNQIAELRELPRDSSKFTKWLRATRLAISYTFGPDSPNVSEFNQIRYRLRLRVTPRPEYELQNAYVHGLNRAASLVESMIDEISEFWENDDIESQISQTDASNASDSKRVFLVHGRDNSAREAVARFLAQLGLDPIVLHELPNRGRTIIEKFEVYSDVKFAVVLLTQDDVGALKNQPSDLRPRARQNVIFELGFFIAAIGRQQVCILKQSAVEGPSDYDGVVYTKFDDSGAWKMQLARELDSAGLSIDSSALLRA